MKIKFDFTEDGKVLYQKNLIGRWDKSDAVYNVTDIRGKFFQCSSMNDVIFHFTRFRSWDDYTTNNTNTYQRDPRIIVKNKERKQRWGLE